MVPPHGACSEKSIYEMSKLNYEAICVSPGSLRHYNRQAKWVPTIGMLPSEMINNIPIIFRQPLTNNFRNNIIITALLFSAYCY